jgi:hypothetical protein
VKDPKDAEIPITEMPVEESAPKRSKPYRRELDTSPEAVLARKKALKEARIEQIMDIMRPVTNKAGKLTWDNKIRNALASSWRLDGRAMRSLSDAASKRLCKEMVGGGDAAQMRRHLVLNVDKGIVDCGHTKDWKTLAVIGTLGDKLLNGNVLEIQVTTKKAPTHVDAADAVAEMFGKRFTNDSSPRLDDAGEKPADGTGRSGSPPEA